MMRHLEEAFASDIHMRRDVDERFSRDGIKVVAHDIGEGKVYERSGVTVTAFLVTHGLVKLRTDTDSITPGARWRSRATRVPAITSSPSARVWTS
jgi:hypothetical protein